MSDTGGVGTLWSDVFKYDERSNLIERIDARRVKTTFDYQNDPLNRLKEVSYNTANALIPTTTHVAAIQAAPKVTYEYETTAQRDKTRLTRVTVENFVTDDLAYDTTYYRLTGVTRTFSGTTGRAMVTNYLYDKADRVREVTYPAQWPSSTRRIARYGYDEASRFKQIDYDGSGSMQSYASGIVYNAESQATSLKIGHTTGANEVKELYTYSLQTGLVTNQQVQRGTGSPTTLLDLSYDYARTGSTAVTGQLTKITNNLDATKNRFYEYDALARLKRAKGGTTGADWQQEYAYDRYGNRTGVTKSGSAPLDAVNTGGQTSFGLTFTNLQNQTLTNRITTAGYEYDAAGNLTRGQDKDGQWQRYEYDAANRLKAVKNDSGTTMAAYSYGAGNQRLKAVEGSSPITTSWYVWEGRQAIAEYDGAAINWRKSYVYLGARLLAADSGGVQATQFYHPDRLGTRLVTNALDGSTAGEQESLPFGAELGAGAAGTRRFTSYDRSGATTLDYAVNRFYNQGLGRFTQVDPIGMGAASLTNPQSLNLYGYCENDPINHTDPEGLFFGFIIAAFIAIGTAAAVAARVIYNAIVKVVVVAKDGLGQLASGIKGFLSHGAGLSLGLDDEGDGGGPGIYWGRVIVAAAVVGAGAVSIYQAKKRPQLKRPPKGRQKPPNSSLGDSTFTLSEIFVLFLAFASAAVALQKPGCAEILGGLDKAQRLIKKARFRDANARNPRLSTFPQIVRDEVATGERGLAAISPVGGSNVYLTPLYFSGNTFVGKAVNLIHELKHLGGFTFEPDGYDYQTDYDEITSKCGFPRVIVRKKP